MYKRIVTRKLLAAFDGLNRGHIGTVTRELGPSAEHFFVGRHALAGTRRTPEAIFRWYQRLLRLMPDIHFDVEDIEVAGPPWRTLAVVRWSGSNSGTDGVLATNRGINLIEISWGKVQAIRIYTDTAALERTLNRLAAGGVVEAAAAMIES